MEHFFVELKELRGAFVRIFGAFFVLAFFFLSVPIFSGSISVSERAIIQVQHDLVPSRVSLIALTPLDPFMARMAVAGTLAFLSVLPLFVFELWMYVRVGLYARERRLFGILMGAGVLLFIAGVWFAYMLLIPLTFSALYKFTPMGSVPFFSLRELVSLVSGLAVLTGCLFELPIVMIVLSSLQIVKSHLWGKYARYALAILLVFSAIITPDGSGISMILLALPLFLAYGAGWLGSKLFTSKSPLAYP